MGFQFKRIEILSIHTHYECKEEINSLIFNVHTAEKIVISQQHHQTTTNLYLQNKKEKDMKNNKKNVCFGDDDAFSDDHNDDDDDEIYLQCTFYFYSVKFF